MKKALLIITVLTAALILTGCGSRFWKDTKETAGDTYDYLFDTSPTSIAYHDRESVPIIEINHEAADVLYKNLNKNELSKRSPIFVTDFTNQDDPNDHSIFGKVMTQQVTDRLVQRGVVITQGEPQPDNYFLPKGVEPKKYNNPPQGNIDLLPPRSGMFSGEYVIGDHYIYMTARITRLDDKAVISAHNWIIPITDNVRQLLPQLPEEDGLEPTVKTKFD